ncbi:MAG: hypothetical protein H0W02_00270 [Ktedonobacteraceae bacterium]|nr:hypothetical protein [Ktedonobacteraceae bacterium]
MRKYCKAYRLGDVRQFSGWVEKRNEQDDMLPDETICYLWDDFTVVTSPVQDTGALFVSSTPEWRTFCVTTLQFAIPEDLRYAYEHPAEQEQPSA